MLRQCNLTEGSEKGDLVNLVHPNLHIDEYKSKMGEDADICVISFKVGGKEPAEDLAAFIERGYEWVLDADVSSGEADDGDFLVFIEAERDPKLAREIYAMMEDIMNLTEQELDDWKVTYPKLEKSVPLTEKDLAKLLPASPEEYKKLVGEEDKEIDSLKTAAGVDVDTKAPDNELTEYLRVAAGLK